MIDRVQWIVGPCVGGDNAATVTTYSPNVSGLVHKVHVDYTSAADNPDFTLSDAGDPASAVGDETSPNGARINQGAYGGTDEASRTPSERLLVLVAPGGGESWLGGTR